MTSFYLDVDKVEVEAGRDANLRIIFDAKPSDFLGDISIKDIIYHFGAADILDEIGEAECRDRFNLVSAE